MCILLQKGGVRSIAKTLSDLCNLTTNTSHVSKRNLQNGLEGPLSLQYYIVSALNNKCSRKSCDIKNVSLILADII